MDVSPNGLRKLPLRVAGSVGVVVSLIYLGGILGQSDATYRSQALFWFVTMFLAGVAAWYADRWVEHGRALAKGSAVAFFVLGLVSGTVFSVAFVLALVLAVAGFAGTSHPDDEPSEA